MSIIACMLNSARKNSALRRRLVAVTAAVAVGFSGGVVAPTATAQSSQPTTIDSMSSDLIDKSGLERLYNTTREDAWDVRNQVMTRLQDVDPATARSLRGAVDGLVDLLFPGLVAQKKAEERAEQKRRAAAKAKADRIARAKAAEERRKLREAREAEERARKASAAKKAAAKKAAAKKRYNTGPCPADADVCVDRNGRRTWLQENGRVTYVAAGMAPGKPGEETPAGTFYVNRKIKDEISYEFNNAPMPYAIYFTNNGHAFHAGDPAYLSNGCVRLTYEAAQKYFQELQIGDKVFIY
ncbi:L,D-transpeptidase [Corynebacterium incognita]|uniref:L,D-transpeptidase n=2 Tax=Corynebacterium incognita TaxID=2754725 RepID=A0A7G7CMX5_9CORY|nr:L,D-transpeptidase [Corynebacterium incognita]